MTFDNFDILHSEPYETIHYWASYDCKPDQEFQKT